MAKYLLVSFKACPWVQRVAIVLREKKVDFEFRHIEADNRPDWFRAISPHNKVPVLRIDDSVSLFESNAISEYLDDTVAPRLHPEDPVARAVNRAWIDYMPSFVDQTSAHAYVDSEEAFNKAAAEIPVPFERLEKGAGEAGQRPLLQRRPLFAGGCGLCALPAAPSLPGANPAGRPDRQIPAAEGLGRGPGGAPLDPLLPAGGVRGDVPRHGETPRQMDLAIRRRLEGGGGVIAAAPEQ